MNDSQQTFWCTIVGAEDTGIRGLLRGIKADAPANEFLKLATGETTDHVAASIERSSMPADQAKLDNFRRLIEVRKDRSEASRDLQDAAKPFIQASSAVDNYVQVRSDSAYLPYLETEGGDRIWLYEFVEILDEVVDYDDIKRELPGLSYAQIDGAIAFLRKISQFNTRAVDIDELEDEALMQQEGFVDQLRAGLADQETMRVLDLHQQDS